VRALVHVRTEHDHQLSPLLSRLKWTAGGHGLLGALPRSFQVTPDIPDRRRATQQKEVRPTGRQPQRESARRPVGTISSASDVTDEPNRNSKPQGARGPGSRRVVGLLQPGG
jgi:hypothetical protein